MFFPCVLRKAVLFRGISGFPKCFWKSESNYCFPISRMQGLIFLLLQPAAVGSALASELQAGLYILTSCVDDSHSAVYFGME